MDIFDFACFGTSLTSADAREWQRDVAKALCVGASVPCAQYDCGKSGETSVWALANTQSVINLRPKAVLIEFAANDCATVHDISTTEFRTNMEGVVAALKAGLPDAALFLMTMNPIIAPALTDRPNVEDYHDVLRSMVDDDLTLIDNYPLWTSPSLTQIPDGLHPTLDADRAVMVPNIIEALRPLVP